MSDIDSAVAKLQDHVQACTTVAFKSAPDYPVENAEPFPCSICFIGTETVHFTNATILHIFPALFLELHFSRVNLKQAYQQINAIAIELPQRLAADPTLGGTVQTIVATQDQPLSGEVRPFQWTPQGVTPIIVSQMLKFVIPIKLLKAPTT